LRSNYIIFDLQPKPSQNTTQSTMISDKIFNPITKKWVLKTGKVGKALLLASTTTGNNPIITRHDGEQILHVILGHLQNLDERTIVNLQRTSKSIYHSVSHHKLMNHWIYDKLKTLAEAQAFQKKAELAINTYLEYNTKLWDYKKWVMNNVDGRHIMPEDLIFFALINELPDETFLKLKDIHYSIPIDNDIYKVYYNIRLYDGDTTIFDRYMEIFEEALKSCKKPKISEYTNKYIDEFYNRKSFGVSCKSATEYNRFYWIYARVNNVMFFENYVGLDNYIFTGATKAVEYNELCNGILHDFPEISKSKDLKTIIYDKYKSTLDKMSKFSECVFDIKINPMNMKYSLFKSFVCNYARKQEYQLHDREFSSLDKIGNQ